MPKDATDTENVIIQFRQMLPAHSATAQAIDARESWETIALKAIDDGYIEVSADFSLLVNACVRRSA